MKKVIFITLLAIFASCKKETPQPQQQNCECWEVIDKNVFNAGGTVYGTATYQNICTGEIQDVYFQDANPAIGYVNCDL